MLFSLNGVIFFFYINCVIGEWLWDSSMMQIFMSCNCCVHVAQMKYTYSCGSTPFCHGNGGTSKGKVSLCPEFIFVLCCVSFCSFLLYRKKIKLGLVKVWLYVILKNGADLHNPMAFSVLPEPVCELAILFGSKILGFFFPGSFKMELLSESENCHNHWSLSHSIWDCEIEEAWSLLYLPQRRIQNNPSPKLDFVIMFMMPV